MRGPLTARQAAILVSAAKGLTDADIAATLGVSRNGVKESLRLIYRKLGARNRAHAVAIAIIRGLIAPDL